MNCPLCKGETKHVCCSDRDRYVCCNPLCGWMEGSPHAHLNRKIQGLPDDDLRTLRAIINGKLSKRIITPEQQRKMQASRDAKKQAARDREVNQK